MFAFVPLLLAAAPPPGLGELPRAVPVSRRLEQEYACTNSCPPKADVVKVIENPHLEPGEQPGCVGGTNINEVTVLSESSSLESIGLFGGLAVKGALQACTANVSCCLKVYLTDRYFEESETLAYSCEVDYAAQEGGLIVGTGERSPHRASPTRAIELA